MGGMRWQVRVGSIRYFGTKVKYLLTTRKLYARMRVRSNDIPREDRLAW